MAQGHLKLPGFQSENQSDFHRSQTRSRLIVCGFNETLRTQKNSLSIAVRKACLASVLLITETTGDKPSVLFLWKSKIF